ncbi:hypothetical protein E2C01_053627 [Portunus trituberculatus]|uniref:Uncharacterized protein n=1 Tax=Portunus trituberculatus TaxID=210409 RepID=A0A5B7GPV7_PORTR|nr:hypothetical protein [Portunus trituberculatus]
MGDTPLMGRSTAGGGCPHQEAFNCYFPAKSITGHPSDAPWMTAPHQKTHEAEKLGMSFLPNPVQEIKNKVIREIRPRSNAGTTTAVDGEEQNDNQPLQNCGNACLHLLSGNSPSPAHPGFIINQVRLVDSTVKVTHDDDVARYDSVACQGSVLY